MQSNFDTYRSLRINEMPEFEVTILPSAEKLTGVGEPGVPPIGPAVANAMARLGLGRPRRLPIVKGAASMAWEGKTLGYICNQLKDPKRNGGRDVAAILKHVVTDSLVQWAWAPGPGRTPAPGTNAEFGALLEAWGDHGNTFTLSATVRANLSTTVAGTSRHAINGRFRTTPSVDARLGRS